MEGLALSALGYGRPTSSIVTTQDSVLLPPGARGDADILPADLLHLRLLRVRRGDTCRGGPASRSLGDGTGSDHYGVLGVPAVPLQVAHLEGQWSRTAAQRSRAASKIQCSAHCLQPTSLTEPVWKAQPCLIMYGPL